MAREFWIMNAGKPVIGDSCTVVADYLEAGSAHLWDLDHAASQVLILELRKMHPFLLAVI